MYEEDVAQNARDLIDQFGEVVQVNLKENKEIEVVFQGGHTATLGVLFQFGYQGTGPTCFAVWLRAAGFEVEMDDVAKMQAPLTLRRDYCGPIMGGKVSGAPSGLPASEKQKVISPSPDANTYALDPPAAPIPSRQQGNGAIRIRCPRCGKSLKATAELVGKRVKCAACSTVMLLRQRSSFENTGPESTADAPAEGRMVIFLFNSDNPPDSDTGYSELAETVLLKHLISYWKESSPQSLDNTTVDACHGDLFEHHVLGDDYCTLRVLAEMIRDGEILADNLVPEFASSLSSGGSVGFIPWAVGIGSLPQVTAQEVHRRLEKDLPGFYVGMVWFPPSTIFEDTASKFCLPQDISIEGGSLVGNWCGTAPQRAAQG